ncbi:Hypothetical predicted protein [Olea europaea subsp. europaea]|uniref:DUF1985 domain-containing protein n=1 Tax=Olea europaea subsp. europaea TaxID=158383 RepID=A0A8S0RLY0_OLEEU|nr:Hypothetical predicted protein [Olea europaea subsp. europaea]
MPRADRYKLGLALIIEGVFNAPDNNVGIDMETLSIVDDLDLFFSYPWGRISYGRSRRCLKLVIASVNILGNVPHGFSARHQQNSRSSLHVYATLQPTETERGQPHIATLVLLNDDPVPALDDLARDSVALQFQGERIGTLEGDTSEEAHDRGGTNGGEEESGADESGEDEGGDSEEDDSEDSDSDRVGRSGQTGTSPPLPTSIELLLPWHRPPLMYDLLQRLD